VVVVQLPRIPVGGLVKLTLFDVASPGFTAPTPAGSVMVIVVVPVDDPFESTAEPVYSNRSPVTWVPEG
jgi:hypothetical protein